MLLSGAVEMRGDGLSLASGQPEKHREDFLEPSTIPDSSFSNLLETYLKMWFLDSVAFLETPLLVSASCPHAVVSGVRSLRLAL